MLGTLSFSISPNSKPFIKVGAKVKAGDVIFIIGSHEDYESSKK